MKDIIIKGNRIVKELKYLLICYIIANLVNVYAIVNYNTEWMELLTWQRFIIFIAVIFYAFTVIIRLIAVALRQLLKKPKRVNT